MQYDAIVHLAPPDVTAHFTSFFCPFRREARAVAFHPRPVRWSGPGCGSAASGSALRQELGVALQSRRGPVDGQAEPSCARASRGTPVPGRARLAAAVLLAESRRRDHAREWSRSVKCAWNAFA